MMALALAQAGKAWGRTSPNPMVGAVVARGERIISRGYHAKAGAPHGEAVALERAGVEARGATLYVTLEPCNHQGRTPPCTARVLSSGVSRVVIGALDPNPHVTGGGAAFLASKGLEVVTDVLGDKCTELNEFYNKQKTTGLPFVLLKAAATLDGKTATVGGDSKWITSEKARAYVHHLRDGVDAVLVGRGTVEKDDPTLNTRLPGRKKGKNPIRVILDTHLKLSLSHRVFNPDLGGPTVIVCAPNHPEDKAEAFAKAGVEVLPVALRRDRVSLEALCRVLGSRDVQSVLIEGGAEVNEAALLSERVVDKLIFFFAPKIIGGRSAVPLIGGSGVRLMNDCLDLEILKTRRIGPDLLVEARPLYSD